MAWKTNNSSFEGGEDFEEINKDLRIDIDDKYTLWKNKFHTLYGS